MTPNIEILRTRDNGVNFFEALLLAEGSGKRLMSNREADEILQDPALLEKYRPLFWAWTGTLVIHEAAGVAFGENVKTDFFVFDVPKRFQGLKDKVLVVQHPNYQQKKEVLKYGITFNLLVVLDESKLKAYDYPQRNGWYLPDAQTGLPIGTESAESDPNARKLWRRDGKAWIGPVSRYDDLYGITRRFVDCYWRPDYFRLGVGVVEPQAKLRFDAESSIDETFNIKWDAKKVLQKLKKLPVKKGREVEVTLRTL